MSRSEIPRVGAHAGMVLMVEEGIDGAEADKLKADLDEAGATVELK